MNIEEAAETLEVSTSELVEFVDVGDSFNPGNTISGFLCRRSDHRYGALVITTVNEIPTEPQVIYCTPKLHYPFGRTPEEERVYHFPKKVVHVEAYEKLDGTNICCYSYADTGGNRYVSFKMRLVPTLRPSKHGDFLGLWKEILQRYPQLTVPSMVKSGLYSLSFEMFGYRNPHTIVYENALDAKLLFGIAQKNAAITPPTRFFDGAVHLKPERSFENPTDLVGFCEEMRAVAEKKNKKLDDETVEGTEGYVFYVLAKTNDWIQYKIKPESIEVLHWNSDTLPPSVIIPTVWNALESTDNLTVEYVNEMLMEEFSKTMVLKSQRRIEKAVESVKIRLEWRKRVSDAYLWTGMDFAKDGKGAVMRVLSQKFERNQMREVFTALKEIGIAE